MPIKPYPVRWEFKAEDYPCWEDVAIEVPSDIEERYYDLFGNRDGSKVGGWPSLIQSEIYWAPWNQHRAQPCLYLPDRFQEKAQWQWGHAGIGYFGRGTGNATDQWTLSVPVRRLEPPLGPYCFCV